RFRFTVDHPFWIMTAQRRTAGASMTSNAGEHIDKDAALPEEPQRQWTLSPKFQQIVAKRVARRDVMQGSLATAIAGFFGPGLVACGGGDDISGPPPAPGPPPP